MKRWVWAGWALFLFAQPAFAADPIVQTAKAWLEASPQNRAQYESALLSFSGDIDQVIEQVRPRGTETQTGEVFFQNFQLPRFQQKYLNHQFHLYVPTHYTPQKPIGVLFWMHGGGSHTDSPEVENAWVAHNTMHKWEGGKRSYARPETDASNFILVGPIAPFDQLLDYKLHASRWDVPAADQYLMDIVTELAHRYNIDYDRVVVAGFSMGGIGAYNQAVRLNDRLAAALMSAGSWQVVAWDAMKYTPVFLHHGAADAYWNSSSDFRWHGTDQAYARMAHELLDSYGVEHRYWEYPGHHAWDSVGEQGWKEFIDGQGGWVANKVRNPYRSGVIALDRWRSYASRNNGGVSWDEDPSPHTLWVSILQTTPGTIRYDHARAEGGGGCSYGSCSLAAFNDWTLHKEDLQLAGARVDANIVGPNALTVSTQNVSLMSLWLHPKMVDVSQPISITLNGQARSYTCEPSLLDALRSYERREDWQMIYHCEVVIDTSGTSCVPRCEGRTCGQDGCGGRCGACSTAEVCQSHACVAACANGQATCGSDCVDLTTDPAHCGACGQACAGGACVAGQCVAAPVGGGDAGTSGTAGAPGAPGSPGAGRALSTELVGSCSCSAEPTLAALAALLLVGLSRRPRRR